MDICGEDKIKDLELRAGTHKVGEEDAKIRVDIYLSKKTKLSRSRIHKLIEEGYIKVQGKPVKPSYRVKTEDRISFKLPEPEETELKPEKFPLDILYEDEDIIVVNKERGMVVHPGAGRRMGTLVNALLFHCKDLSGVGGRLRPGIVHRLDKETSGIIVVAKNDLSHQNLSTQFKERKVDKKYVALVFGNIKGDEGEIKTLIGRHPKIRKRMKATKMETKGKKLKEAVTHYKVLERFGEFTLVEARPITGRTHQIRVHFSYIGHPVVGDTVYGKKKKFLNLKGQLLHAKEIRFSHPRTGKEMYIKTSEPRDMRNIIEKLRNEGHQLKMKTRI